MPTLNNLALTVNPVRQNFDAKAANHPKAVIPRMNQLDFKKHHRKIQKKRPKKAEGSKRIELLHKLNILKLAECIKFLCQFGPYTTTQERLARLMDNLKDSSQKRTSPLAIRNRLKVLKDIKVNNIPIIETRKTVRGFMVTVNGAAFDIWHKSYQQEYRDLSPFPDILGRMEGHIRSDEIDTCNYTNNIPASGNCLIENPVGYYEDLKKDEEVYQEVEMEDEKIIIAVQSVVKQNRVLRCLPGYAYQSAIKFVYANVKWRMESESHGMPLYQTVSKCVQKLSEDADLKGGFDLKPEDVGPTYEKIRMIKQFYNLIPFKSPEKTNPIEHSNVLPCYEHQSSAYQEFKPKSDYNGPTPEQRKTALSVTGALLKNLKLEG